MENRSSPQNINEVPDSLVKTGSGEIGNTSNQPSPNIVYSQTPAPYAIADTQQVGALMTELGVSAKTINRTALYLDGGNKLVNFGMTYPKTIGHLRYAYHPDLSQVEGPIVRLSTRMRWRNRTAEDINSSLVHELEHVAQLDRRDVKMKLGHLAIWGMSLVGALTGQELTANSLVLQTAAVLAGAAAGYYLGYLLAPHEKQARHRARQVKSSAITSKR